MIRTFFQIILEERYLDKGLVIIFTGDGKGKTCAAMGIALRACGHAMPVSVIQFIKSSAATGECLAAGRLAPEMEFVSLGRGFVTGCENDVPLVDHKKAARETLALARQRMLSDTREILILDEINNAIHLGLIDINDVLDLVRSKPPRLHLILTGRNAHPDLIAIADLVTEMRSLKHPFDSGKPAVKGIDY
jgi:cob(I)alamin adenosyltransferase